MRTVLITGGARGIGQSIVRIFEQNGYNVIAPKREELNLLDSKSIAAFIEKNQNVTFDVIINNAGINDVHLIEEVTDEEIYNTLQVNLIAPMMLVRGFVKKMKENSYGRIVNIASVWAVVSKEGRSTYSASKNGLHGVTNTLALELAPFNILVNTVCPGFTLTELTTKNNSPENIALISQNIPMQRMARPEEIAQVVFFLSHDTNTYLTGQKIVVDGGYTVK